MRIGADLDGVQYPFDNDARLVVASVRGIDPMALPRPVVWDFPAEQWGMDMDEFWHHWFEDVKRGGAWHRQAPIAGTIEGLTKLRDAGHSIHIVTSRKGAEAATMQWIQKHDIPYDAVTIARDKTSVNIDLLVDDWEQNWREVTEAGGRCLIWDQPWNSHVTEAERVRSWDDVLEIVGEA